MARIIGGIALSHTPTIGFAHDHGKANDPVWKPVFDAISPAKAWLAEQRPDVAVLTYNDHVTSFFFDHYSPFALGIGERFAVADEGGGARALPPLRNHMGLAHHIAHSLFADEFDLSTFQDKPLDHGCFSPLSVLCDHAEGWPMRVIPLQMGVLQFPIPTARRFWKLGQALRRAIDSFEEDLRVVLIATGGLSHQVHGERAGFNNPQWDADFLTLFEHDPQALTQLTHAEYAQLGGFEGAEVVMWLTMRAALPAQVRKVHQAYTLPSMTGIACAVYEVDASAPRAHQQQRAHVDARQQLAGVHALPGTYPFDLARSVKGYRLNRFLHGLIEPQARNAFLADEAQSCRDAGLTDEEAQLVQQRDWQGLIRYGAIFFVLEKLAAVSGLSNLHVYAHMRGQALEAFLATRNAPSAVYSVAAAPLACDSDGSGLVNHRPPS
jgi:gallate dioxygenase